jgi:hypothetical protein
VPALLVAGMLWLLSPTNKVAIKTTGLGALELTRCGRSVGAGSGDPKRRARLDITRLPITIFTNSRACRADVRYDHTSEAGRVEARSNKITTVLGLY